MLNNIDKFHKLYSFLILYKRSLDKNFVGNDELLRIAKEITKMEDDEYLVKSKIVKKILDTVNLYIFDWLVSNNFKTNDKDFNEIWIIKITSKVALIKPTNLNQAKLVIIAKDYMKKHLNT